MWHVPKSEAIFIFERFCIVIYRRCNSNWLVFFVAFFVGCKLFKLGLCRVNITLICEAFWLAYFSFIFEACFFCKRRSVLKWNLSETVVLYSPANSQYLVSYITKWLNDGRFLLWKILINEWYSTVILVYHKFLVKEFLVVEHVVA